MPSQNATEERLLERAISRPVTNQVTYPVLNSVQLRCQGLVISQKVEINSSVASIHGSWITHSSLQILLPSYRKIPCRMARVMALRIGSRIESVTLTKPR